MRLLKGKEPELIECFEKYDVHAGTNRNIKEIHR